MIRSGLLWVIKLYQVAISPYLPSLCRFCPSCSEYTKQAIDKYGVRKGIIMGCNRIVRCQPWGGKGFDPVR